MKYILSRDTQKAGKLCWRRVLPLLVAVLMVFTAAAPGLSALASSPICGLEEHQHTSSCYTEQLRCSNTDEDHVHGSDCYASVLSCGKSEHTHTASCYPEETPAPVETPSAEPTEPADHETEAPIDSVEPSAEPSTEPESDGGEEINPSPEPTEPDEGETPSTALVESVIANPSAVAVGETAIFSAIAANAESLTYTLTRDGEVIASGSLSTESAVYSFAPQAAGRYTFTVTATAADGSKSTGSTSITAGTEDAGFYVRLSPSQRYAVGGSSVGYTLITPADAEITSCHITVRQAGALIYESSEYQEKIIVGARSLKNVSDITAYVRLTDAAGRVAEYISTIPCAVYKVESRAQWESTMKNVKLTGVWMDDLLAIAESQVGYKESALYFIVRDDGSVQGWTRYGAWVGMPFEEWCAMFVSFCLNYAQVPSGSFPRYNNCHSWVSALKNYGLYETASKAEPQKGDLIFYDWEGDGHIDHVGIVRRCENGTVYALEGNHNKGVGYTSYSASDKRIAGYGLLNRAYSGVEKAEENTWSLTWSGEGMDVEITGGDAAAVSEKADIVVEELKKLTPPYAAVMPTISQEMHEDWEDVLTFRRLYNITLEENGEEIIPEDEISITIRYEEPVALEDGARAIVYGATEEDEKLAAEALAVTEQSKEELGYVTFTTSSTGYVAVAESREEQIRTLRAEADGVDVSADYTKRAKIDGAELVVERLYADDPDAAGMFLALTDQMDGAMREALPRMLVMRISLIKDDEAIAAKMPLSCTARIPGTSGMRAYLLYESESGAYAAKELSSDGDTFTFSFKEGAVLGAVLLAPNRGAETDAQLAQ